MELDYRYWDTGGALLSNQKPTLYIGKYILKIVCVYNLSDLAKAFKNDRELSQYIKSHLDEAFISSVHKYGTNKYYLSIESPDCIWGEKSIKSRREKAELYAPIIQKFMVDALTDNLYIMEDGELVKQ